ncbi:MAG: DUF86 domain-containing protein [Pseudomonadota bacterium]|nr:DUF86 domain-containing protein [Xanthomonadaceae bacterium]MDE2248269.1 DUF86 domain-containing protein [Xanthomonadaceae bacterium]MDE3211258.1 DUF86 domain-containing protein [Pseudomonadota bacterium]
MTDRGLRDYIEHMLEAARQACGYVDGMDRDEFLHDRRTQQAVILNLVILGEAATRLMKEHASFLAAYPAVPWNSMKGMRNRLAHGYFDIDLQVVWETVQTNLPALVDALPAILRAADGHSEPRH